MTPFSYLNLELKFQVSFPPSGAGPIREGNFRSAFSTELGFVLPSSPRWQHCRRAKGWKWSASMTEDLLPGVANAYSLGTPERIGAVTVPMMSSWLQRAKYDKFG